MNSFIYAVGTLFIDYNENLKYLNVKDKRLWYLFKNLDEAKSCILNNSSDIFEYYYNYALIERCYLIDHCKKGQKMT